MVFDSTEIAQLHMDMLNRKPRPSTTEDLLMEEALLQDIKYGGHKNAELAKALLKKDDIIENDDDEAQKKQEEETAKKREEAMSKL